MEAGGNSFKYGNVGPHVWPHVFLELEPYREQVIQLIDSVFTESKLPSIDDDRKPHVNNLNQNFDKKEWQALWQRINRKAVYAVDFESSELIEKCVKVFSSVSGFTEAHLFGATSRAKGRD